MSDEDCEVYELELAAGRTESAGRDIVLERRRRFLALGRPGWRRKYSQVVPQLSTMEEFLAANRRAAGRDRLLVIVAYSHRCKACKRIASKFRRLALKYKGEVDCYEVEQGASLPLLQRLEVKRVPWLQVFDSDHATRLASQPAGVSDFKRAEVKVLSAMVSMQKRRGFLRRLTAKNPNLVRLAESVGGERTVMPASQPVSGPRSITPVEADRSLNMPPPSLLRD